SNGTNTPNDVGTPTQVASVAIQPSDEPGVSQTPTQPAAAQQDGSLLASNSVDTVQTGNDVDQPLSNGTNTPNDDGTPTQVASVATQPSDEPRVRQTQAQPAAAQQDGNVLAANGVDSAQTGNDGDQPLSDGTNTPNDVNSPTQVASVATQPSDEPGVSQTPTQLAAAQQDDSLLASNGAHSAQGNDNIQNDSNPNNGVGTQTQYSEDNESDGLLASNNNKGDYLGKSDQTFGGSADFNISQESSTNDDGLVIASNSKVMSQQDVYDESVSPSFVGDGAQSPIDVDSGDKANFVDGTGSMLDPDNDLPIA
ncbi:hypothetical protein, partial [Vibrio owensii]